MKEEVVQTLSYIGNLNMIEPEQYDEYGNIIKIKPLSTFGRTMTEYDTHRIHETKDLFDSNCSYCRTAAKKIRSYWQDQEDALNE